MQFDATETLGALAKLPPETPKPVDPSTTAGGLWRAVRNAVPAAAAETAAAVVKLGTMAPEGSSASGGRTEQIGQELERSLRNVAESYGPDPMTASKAEQVVFGLTRGVGKAVGYGLTTGPLAPLGFGIDEGLTEREKLIRQGVDEATASKVGAVAGAINTVGFAIPAAGATVARTVGLATLSGPASFVAQQAGSREILRAADYESIASSYDPTDTLGLALSAIPFGFGAWAMRGRLSGKAGAQSSKPGALSGKPDALSGKPAPDAIPVEPARAADEAGAVVPLEQAPARAEVAPVTPEPIIRQEHVDAAMVKNLVDFDQAVRENPPPPDILPPKETPADVPTPEKLGTQEGEAVSPPIKEALPAVKEAQRAIESVDATGRNLDELLAEGKLGDDAHNLAIGLSEMPDKAAQARLLADYARAVEANPKRPTADIAADVVEAHRKGQEYSKAPEAKVQREAVPVIDMIRARADQVAMETPDMVVRTTEDGQVITAKAEIERIRREAAEGTDDTLGANDAPLIDVAIRCALNFGA